MVALFGAVFGMLRQQAARGFQLGPPTCGEQGAVCTLISGCCDGLTCVTSAINTSYGICVPGEGGMVSTGTTLISPFSETAVEEVSALMQTRLDRTHDRSPGGTESAHRGDPSPQGTKRLQAEDAIGHQAAQRQDP